MTWRQTVEQWHGGQLVIVWVCLTALTLAVATGIRVLAARWEEAEGLKSLSEYTTCMASPIDQPPRGAGEQAADGTSPRVGYPMGCLNASNYAYNHARLQSARVTARATWAVALGVGASALWMTWVWLGSRSPRRGVT